MSELLSIQDFIQPYAQAISSILEVEVTIVDDEFVRIGGTGIYESYIGDKVAHGSFFQSILEKGKPGIIKDVKKEFSCEKCDAKDICKELANIGFPIHKGDRVVGVIGIIAFSVEQREKVINSMNRLSKFLRYMSELLESKLLTIEASKQLELQINEIISNDKTKSSFENIIGNNEKFLSTVYKAKLISKSCSTVMIRGESGTGKELLARAIHSASSRSDRLFIAVNCASIPENLIESELFGYEEGAFTGALKGGKVGKFELANKSTLFLDEIGDMPLSMQAKLLRVLQENTVDRVGGKIPVPIDVRIIAATHRDLEAMVENGEFRQDLYYRLNVIPLNIPPLRERKDDILLIVQDLLIKYCKELRKPMLQFNYAVEKALTSYDWPGNFRQVKNVIEYMVNMAESNIITVNEIPEYIKKEAQNNFIGTGKGLTSLVEEYEKNILKKLISENSISIDKISMAKDLKISKATLYRKLSRYNLL
jgi:transcriptional regulator with PAS, ATPase and Fis domain